MLVVAAVVMGLLGACDAAGSPGDDGVGTAPPGLHPTRLAGTTWRIVSAQGRPIPGGDDQVAFDETRVFGSAGCNRFTAGVAYRPDTGAISMLQPATTEMACPGARDTFERGFLQALVGARTASLDPTGRLSLEGLGGPIVLEPSDRPRPTD